MPLRDCPEFVGRLFLPGGKAQLGMFRPLRPNRWRIGHRNHLEKVEKVSVDNQVPFCTVPAPRILVVSEEAIEFVVEEEILVLREFLGVAIAAFA